MSEFGSGNILNAEVGMRKWEYIEFGIWNAEGGKRAEGEKRRRWEEGSMAFRAKRIV